MEKQQLVISNRLGYNGIFYETIFPEHQDVFLPRGSLVLAGDCLCVFRRAAQAGQRHDAVYLAAGLSAVYQSAAQSPDFEAVDSCVNSRLIKSTEIMLAGIFFQTRAIFGRV